MDLLGVYEKISCQRGRTQMPGTPGNRRGKETGDEDWGQDDLRLLMLVISRARDLEKVLITLA